MIYKILTPFALLASLAGCATLPEPPRITAYAGDDCRASAYQYLQGQADTALETVYILDQVRVIRPDQAYTEDLRPARLNFDINRQGKVARVFCG